MAVNHHFLENNMTDIAIKVENLSKLYKIGARQQGYKTLRESVMGILTAPMQRFKKIPQSAIRNPQSESIWALKDVSFEVKQGEVVGIIGGNGAGKTTLLKILSRITEPTEGRAEIYGRVGSLLEVGTGFHPELTGRENIYLNGAILGMRKAEIEHKFHEIVAFSEIEKFIDTPVKRYSSGMYVRLAFAVAAHLEPEVLVVDEVLAVGDAAFQKKCLGKMGDVAKEGRTVLFVSHNMGAIIALCPRCLLMNNGRLEMAGAVREVTARYQAKSFATAADRSDLRTAERRGTGKAVFSSINIKPVTQYGEPIPVAYTGCNLSIEIEIDCHVDIADSNVAIVVYDLNGYRLIDVNTAQKGTFVSLKAGQHVMVVFVLREVLLLPGTYLVSVWLGRGGIEHTDFIEYATSFSMAADAEGTKHVEVFPGPYLCRFDSSVTYQEGPGE